MKRPAFQFYTGDWRKNAKLRRCSDAARGAWIDVLCAMHDSEEYGVLRWPLAEIARVAGAKLKLLHELRDKDVMKGSDTEVSAYVHTPRHAGRAGAPVTLIVASAGPCWYSSRMVRDEWARKTRGSSTWFQPSPDTSPTHGQGERQGDKPSGAPTQRQGDGASSSSSSSRSSSLIVTTVGAATSHPDAGRSTSTPRATTPAVAKTQALIEEHRVASERAAPPPDDLMAPYRKPMREPGQDESEAA